MAKSEIYAKSSLGKKRPLFVSDFRKIKELGSGKYGQVSLVQYLCFKIDRKILVLYAL